MAVSSNAPQHSECYAIVTGASRGIGNTIATALWNDGYNLILLARSYNDLVNVKNNLKPNSLQHIEVYALDITKEKDVEDLFDKLSQQNIAIQVLVNNAGCFAIGTTDLKLDEFHKLLDTNLLGPYNMIKGVLPIMKKQHSGHIINIGSIAGNHAISGIGGYSASKYALRGFNDSLFKELSPYGIKVTSISPSVTDTDMSTDFPGFKDGEKIQTQDIAKTVVFLLSLSGSASIQDIEIYNSKMIAHATKGQSLPID